MTNLELKAYEIGIKEANEQRRIVPACKSKRMNEMMNEIRNNLLPLIIAYDEGVAYEINRQMRLEL